jgi:presenilin-like A22 family membrane protease
MSYAHERFDTFQIDWLTVILVGLVGLFQGVSLYAAQWLLDALARLDTEPTQTTDITIGLEIIAIAAVEIAVILLLWRAWKRVPERLRRYVKTGVKVVGGLAIVVAGLYTWAFNGFQLNSIVLAAGATVSYWLVKRYDMKWVLFNIAALTLGVGMTVAGAMQVAPVVVIVLMVAFTIYDHAAVNLSGIMGSLVEMSSSVGIPNFVVVPKTIRFDLSSVKTALQDDGEKPDNLAFMIGIGDFIFPTVLVVSAYVTLDSLALPVIGAIAGTVVAMIVLRDSLERANSGLPALPWLNTGAIGGFVAGILVSGIPFMTALGL